jgi:sugar transferase EpsL
MTPTSSQPVAAPPMSGAQPATRRPGPGRRVAKRSLDIALSTLALIVLSPLIAFVAVVVLCALGRPVLFSQMRPGIGGRLFRLYKFRTMKLTEPGAAQPDARRLTRIGAFLRRTSLDELPELWNVLRGEMSIVGPRPLLPEYLPLYSAVQARRHEMLPGVTGLAQVRGRNALSWQEKFALDVWYVDNWSLWLDVKILWATVATVVRREGINGDGHATAEPFRGNAAK